MADVDIEKKQPGPWVSILGLMVIVAAIWLLLEAADSREPQIVEESTPDAVAPSATPEGALAVPTDSSAAGAALQVQEFSDFIASTGADVGATHDYTMEGLEKLVAALDALVSRETADVAEVEAIRDALLLEAHAIQQDPASDARAAQVHEAFVTATNLLNRIQEAHYPDLDDEVSALGDAARDVRPEGDLLDQKEQVTDFFTEADGVLRRMATTSDVAYAQ